MLQYDSTPTRVQRVRARAYCVMIAVAALAMAAVFLLPRILTLLP